MAFDRRDTTSVDKRCAQSLGWFITAAALCALVIVQSACGRANGRGAEAPARLSNEGTTRISRTAAPGVELSLMLERDSEVIRNMVALVRADRPERIEHSLAFCVPDFTYRLSVVVDGQPLAEMESFDLSNAPGPLSSRLAGERRLGDGGRLIFAVVRVIDPQVKSIALSFGGTIVDATNVNAPYVALASRQGSLVSTSVADLEVVARGGHGEELSRTKVPFEGFVPSC